MAWELTAVIGAGVFIAGWAMGFWYGLSFGGPPPGAEKREHEI